MVRRWTYYVACALLLLSLGTTAVAQTRAVNEHSKGDRLRSSSGKRVNGSGLRTTAYDGIHHLVGLHVDGGYSKMFGNMPQVSNRPGGYTLGLGLDYSYTGRGLIIQTGLAVRWQDVQNNVLNDSLVINQIKDSEGTPYRLKYDMTDRVDQARNLYIQLPIMAGRYFYGAYFLAGLKLNFQLMGNTKTKLNVTSTASYDRYIGPWEEMDNHGIRKEVEEVRNGGKLNLKFDVMATAEIGYEWSLGNYGKKGYHKKNALDYRLRLGAFVECGRLDIMPKGDKKSYIIPDASRYDFSTFEFNHSFSTEAARSYHVRNFFTGVRLTFFFYGKQSTEKCILCGPLGDETKMR